MGVHLLTLCPLRGTGHFLRLLLIMTNVLRTWAHTPLWDPAFLERALVTWACSSPKPSARCGAQAGLVPGKANPQLPGGLSGIRAPQGVGLRGTKAAPASDTRTPEAPPVLCPPSREHRGAGGGPQGSPSGAAYYLARLVCSWDFQEPSLLIWKVGIMTGSSQSCWES